MKSLCKLLLFTMVVWLGALSLTPVEASVAYDPEYVRIYRQGTSVFYLNKRSIAIENYNPPYYRLSVTTRTEYDPSLRLPESTQDGSRLVFDYDYDNKTISLVRGRRGNRTIDVSNDEDWQYPAEAKPVALAAFCVVYGIPFYKYKSYNLLYV